MGFEKEILQELRAIRIAIENHIQCEEERRAAVARANRQREQAFYEGVASRARELEGSEARLDQLLAVSRQR